MLSRQCSVLAKARLADSAQSVTRHSSQVTRHSAMALRFLVIAAATALLAAIATCSLAPSPNMREMWWIPDWADRNGNFRNFPVFAVFAALLLFVFRSFQLKTVNCSLITALPCTARADIGWSTYGAFVGAALAAACFRLLTTAN